MVVGFIAAASLAACAEDGEPDEMGTSAEFFQGTRTEHRDLVMDCIRDSGYEADPYVTLEGSAAIQLPNEQEGPDRSEAVERCREALPPVPYPQTEAEIQEMYENLVDAHDCLSASSIETLPAPSFQWFLEDYRAEDGEGWDPYWDVPRPQLQTAFEVCPRDPDAWW